LTASEALIEILEEKAIINRKNDAEKPNAQDG